MENDPRAAASLANALDVVRRMVDPEQAAILEAAARMLREQAARIQALEAGSRSAS